jgi:fructose-bisphosphate aldolase class I
MSLRPRYRDLEHPELLPKYPGREVLECGAAIRKIRMTHHHQNHIAATEHLSAINQLDAPKAWKLSFSYGRALQDEALKAWRGKSENSRAGQQAFYHRARCGSAAALGRYTSAMENQSAAA